MGATALLAMGLWFGGALVALRTGVAVPVFDATTVGFGVMMGILFAPGALVTAVASGTVLWRYYHPGEPQPRLGAVLGTETAAASLAGGACSVSLATAGNAVVQGAMAPLEAAGFGLALGVPSVVFAVALAGWVVFPLAAFGGWYHERAKRTRA